MHAERKNTIVFALLGLGWIFAATRTTGLVWVLYWSGFSCLLVSAAYAGLGPNVLGKKPTGSIAWWAVVLLLPYFALTILLWHIVRLIERQERYHEVAAGWWLGRRALGNELPPDTSLVVDLTSEFSEPRGVLRGRTYLCAPALDHSVPVDSSFDSIAASVAGANGNVYFHCAQGHGRSAMVVAGLMVRNGLAPDVDAAVEMLRSVRAGVRLTRSQREWAIRVSRTTVEPARVMAELVQGMATPAPVMAVRPVHE